MKVIIIGSKGFIGRHAVRYFIEKNYDVWGADVVVDYVNTDRYYLIDASNSDFNSVFHNVQYDLCVNCSGAASVPESIKNPLRDYYLNTVNVFKILEAIRIYQPECKFINLSSAAVYGNPKHLPIKETSDTNPLSPYGIHKLQAEQLCKEYNEFYQLRTCSLRIFSAYGLGLQKQLFWDLFCKAKSGVPFVLYGTGNESRDFIYISDLLKAIDLIAEKASFNAGIINVANGEEVLIKNAVADFFNLFNHTITYSFSGEIREGDPANWMADIQTLISFGYKPSVDMKTGLEKYYRWAEEISLTK